MTSDRHERTLEVLESYALGDLSDDDRQQVEDHLLACDDCATRLHSLQDVLVALAGSTAVMPRDDLKRRVMASLPAKPPGSAPVPVRHDVPSHRVAWWMASAAVAAILVLAVGASWMLVRANQRRTDAALHIAQASIAELQARLDRFAGQADLALAILTAGDMREVALAATVPAAPSTARAYWSPTRGLLLVADALPEPPPGRVYQVWVIADRAPVSAGLLGDGRARRGMLIVPPPRAGVTGAVTVAVTDEPPGGLAAPSGTVRLAGSV